MTTVYSDLVGSSTVPTPAAAPVVDGSFPPAAAVPPLPAPAQAPPQPLAARIEARQSFLSKFLKRNTPTAELPITTTTSEPSQIHATTPGEPHLPRYGRIRIVGKRDSHYMSSSLNTYGSHLKCKLSATDDTLVVKCTAGSGESLYGLLKARHVLLERGQPCLRRIP